MKITIYTITDCQFSKQEKDYLASHQLSYEEKNLETNKEFLTEMLAVSNNFAGTPVTKIEKDNGQITVLKGFTKEEFDAALGFAAAPAKPAEPVVEAPKPAEPVTPPTPMPAPPAPVPPQPVTPPVVEPTTPTPPSTSPNPVSPPPPQNPQMTSILDNLQQKSQAPSAVPPAQVSPATSLPNIPDFQTPTTN